MNFIFSLFISFFATMLSFYIVYREYEKEKKLVVYFLLSLIFEIADLIMLRYFYNETTLSYLLRAGLIISILGAAAYTDLKDFRIMNKTIILGLVYRGILIPIDFFSLEKFFVSELLSDLIAAGAVALVCFICRIFIKNSIGFGDIKLFIVMGLFEGLRGIFGAIFMSLIISFIVSIIMLVQKKMSKKDKIAFAPFLFYGTMVSIILTGS